MSVPDLKAALSYDDAGLPHITLISCKGPVLSVWDGQDMPSLPLLRGCTVASQSDTGNLCILHGNERLCEVSHGMQDSDARDRDGDPVVVAVGAHYRSQAITKEDFLLHVVNVRLLAQH